MSYANYNRDIESNIIERHEIEINELKKKVFGTPCSNCMKSLSELCFIVLFIIVYLKAFEYIDKNGNIIKQ